MEATMTFPQVLMFLGLLTYGVNSFNSLPPSANQDSPWRNEAAGLYKEAKVLKTGHYADTIILATERGVIEVRASKAIGSEWVDVVVDSKGELVTSTLHKGAAQACEESVVITQSGARVVGNQEITDAYGEPNGSYETVECEK
jgi:hypothetical protein